MLVGARVVDATVVPVGMQHLDGPGVGQVLDQGDGNPAAKLVLFHQRVVLVIDPEHVGLKDVQAHGLPDVGVDDVPLEAVVVHDVDGAQLGIHPVDGVIHGVVNGDGFGVTNVGVDNSPTLAAVHPRLFNLGIVASISPEKQTVFRINGHGGGDLQVVFDNGALVPAVILGHDDASVTTLTSFVLNFRPIDVSGQPIGSNVKRSGNVLRGHFDNGLTVANHGSRMTSASRNERPLYSSLHGIGDVQHHGLGVVVHAGDAGAVPQDGELPAVVGGLNDLSVNVGPGAEDDLGVSTPYGSANSAEMVIELEAFSA